MNNQKDRVFFKATKETNSQDEAPESEVDDSEEHDV